MVVLLTTSVVAFLTLCILIEIEGHASICSDIVFVFAGMTIGILLALDLVDVDFFVFAYFRYYVNCVLRRWLMCFFLWGDVYSAQDNAFEVVRLALEIIGVDLNEVLKLFST